MLKQFVTILERLGLGAIETSSPVLLAVSGGIDSMCMADLFLRSGIPFALAHCNFHLRGEESDGDEALVRTWAENAHVRFHKTDFDTLAFASENGDSVEMAARELRYRWFASLCRNEGYGVLAIAHNANDNAETLFLNLARGTGMKGLSGMSEESVLPFDDPERTVRVVRPLLSFTRKEIEGHVRANGVPYRNDRTNSETEYKRNKIRHLIFPVFEQMNPSFIRTVNREMAYFSQAESIADRYAASVLDTLVQEKAEGVFLPLAGLTAAKDWEYVLYRFLDRFAFNAAVVSDLCRLIRSRTTFPGKTFNAPEHVLVTAADGLIVRLRTGLNEVMVEVRNGGTYEFNGLHVGVSTVRRDSLASLKMPAGTLAFDAARLQFPFLLRRWREGDWFRPFGMKGRKKISDFFTDLKYDLFRKGEAVMVVDPAAPDVESGHVAAVLGERIDDHCRIVPDTENVLIITLLR